MFHPDDHVWLSTRNLLRRQPCRKPSPRFVGPFKVLRRVNEVTYRPQLPDLTILSCLLMTEGVLEPHMGGVTHSPEPLVHCRGHVLARLVSQNTLEGSQPGGGVPK